MIIYSVTISIQKEIAEEWLEWMSKIHIPEVMETGFFKSYQIAELLEPIQDSNTLTFNVSYQCKDIESLNNYRENFAPALQNKHNERYKDKAIAFRSILKQIN